LVNRRMEINGKAYFGEVVEVAVLHLHQVGDGGVAEVHV
jgi:hypothetical protein